MICVVTAITVTLHGFRPGTWPLEC